MPLRVSSDMAQYDKSEKTKIQYGRDTLIYIYIYTYVDLLQRSAL